MVVRSGFPILKTDDLPRLVRFYRDAFDAVRTYGFPAPDDESRDVFVVLRMGGAFLAIGRELDIGGNDSRAALWFYVDDIDEVTRRAHAAGATIVAPPQEMPWGERVAQVRDPDGFLVYLGVRATDEAPDAS
ncbi:MULTISPECIES: VOC family protein [Citricoccus]|uniref:VOC family protein n=1 Tax=Citricoccus TaxID=169133 RepID=UPI000255DFCA|nr:VOC family protein [Citricoccus sp. CH26A]